jgi:hypothetical protein
LVAVNPRRLASLVIADTPLYLPHRTFIAPSSLLDSARWINFRSISEMGLPAARFESRISTTSTSLAIDAE